MSLWSLVLILSILFVVTLLLKNTIRVIVDPSQKLIKDFSEFKAKKKSILDFAWFALLHTRRVDKC